MQVAYKVRPRSIMEARTGLVRYLSRLLAAERCRRPPARSRELAYCDQAVLALRWFRDRACVDALGRDHGHGARPPTCIPAEAVDVLSQQAPRPNTSTNTSAETR